MNICWFLFILKKKMLTFCLKMVIMRTLCTRRLQRYYKPKVFCIYISKSQLHNFGLKCLKNTQLTFFFLEGNRELK